MKLLQTSWQTQLATAGFALACFALLLLLPIFEASAGAGGGGGGGGNGGGLSNRTPAGSSTRTSTGGRVTQNSDGTATVTEQRGNQVVETTVDMSTGQTTNTRSYSESDGGNGFNFPRPGGGGTTPPNSTDPNSPTGNPDPNSGVPTPPGGGGSTPTPLTPADLRPTAINPDACELGDLTPPPANSGLCAAQPVTMIVQNDSGRNITSAESFPYEFSYRETNPEGSWVVADTGTFRGNVSAGGTFSIGGVVSGLPEFGAFELRGFIDADDITAPLTIDPFPQTQPVPKPDQTITVGPNGMYGTFSLFTGLGGTAQDFVKSGQTAELSWVVDSSMLLECSVTGPGVGVSFTHDPAQLFASTGDVVTDTTANPVSSADLQSTAEFEMTCVPQPVNRFVPTDDLEYVVVATVEVIPTFQEI